LGMFDSAQRRGAHHVVGGVAGHQLLHGEDLVGGAVGGDGELVAEGLRGSVGPAGAALALVADGVDKGGPSDAGVEVVGEGGDVNVGRHVVGAGHVALAEGKDTEHALGLEQGHASESLVDTGSPGRLQREGGGGGGGGAGGGIVLRGSGERSGGAKPTHTPAWS
jgi:hypothetical protein